MLNNAVLQFTDGVFLARESVESLEASLPASMLSLLATGFFQSVVAYSGTFVAQYHGAGDRAGVRASYRAGMWMAFAAGLVSIALVPLGRSLAPLAGANPEVASRAREYYTIVSCGAVALCAQAAAAAYFTGQGRTRIVFWTNVLGNAFNIALDPVLIFGLCGAPRLGMAGAAYATVAAMFLQWAVLWYFSREKPPARAILPRAPDASGRHGGRPSPPRRAILPRAPDARLVLRILRYGVPSGAYTVLNILSFTVFVFATGRVGDMALAVSNACFKVNYLLIAPMEGFAICAATLVAQAQGRGDGDAAAKAAWRTLALGLALVAALSLLAVAFHRPVLDMFASPGMDRGYLHSLGFKLFALMAAWQMFDAADVIISGALKGAGDTAFVMWWMVAAAFGFWLPLVWLVAKFDNTMPALWGTMVAYVALICAGTVLRFRLGRWRSIKVLESSSGRAAGPR